MGFALRLVLYQHGRPGGTRVIKHLKQNNYVSINDNVPTNCGLWKEDRFIAFKMTDLFLYENLIDNLMIIYKGDDEEIIYAVFPLQFGVNPMACGE